MRLLRVGRPQLPYLRRLLRVTQPRCLERLVRLEPRLVRVRIRVRVGVRVRVRVRVRIRVRVRVRVRVS